MIVYEVNIEIEPEIYNQYQEWIGPHAQEVTMHKGFQKVDIFETTSDLGKPLFVCHYWLDDQESLDAYLKDHAPKLRADADKKFGSKIKGIRRVLKKV
jgi:hypothetical protein